MGFIAWIIEGIVGHWSLNETMHDASPLANAPLIRQTRRLHRWLFALAIGLVLAVAAVFACVRMR